MKSRHVYYALVIVLLCIGSKLNAQEKAANWQQELHEQIQLFGHRNWILVVDAAYPLQSKQGIKTIVTNEHQLDVVEEVLKSINHAEHIYPEIFMDKEIDFVSEEASEGIDMYKIAVNNLLNQDRVAKVLHEDLIKMVDESAEVFNILILKSNITIPYTSVFFRLNCGYWDSDAEKELREKMKGKHL